MKTKTIERLVKVLATTKDKKETATLEKEILKEMKIGEIYISEKYLLVLEKKSKKKLIIKALITERKIN